MAKVAPKRFGIAKSYPTRLGGISVDLADVGTFRTELQFEPEGI